MCRLLSCELLEDREREMGSMIQRYVRSTRRLFAVFLKTKYNELSQK